uniref:hypothetical protein n=1 Tax=Mycobacteroides abscessus TaxID=36809 RepID=UPI00094166FE|nr:hypothetical protein [Mycobacteroides abscessus]
MTFLEAKAISNALPRGASWTLHIQTPDLDEPRLELQGTVIRSEAPFPDAPPQSGEFDGVQYRYSFGTPGFVVDPAWRIMNGKPRVYDNAYRSLPNAVAAASITDGAGGGPTLFDDVAMLYYAPLKTDAIRLTYNTIRFGSGTAWIAICSNYDMTNYAALKHNGVFLNGLWQHDTVEVVTGTGPVTTQSRVTPVQYTTATNQNYTAEYNPLTNAYSLYVGTSLTPIVSWTDTTQLVNHGEGERYFGLGFKSDLLTPGVEISDIIIADTP